MDDRDRLAFYPFVVVRIACRVCSRNGGWQPNSGQRSVSPTSYDCPWRARTRT